MVALVVSGYLALAAFVAFALAVALVRGFPPAGMTLASLIIIPLWERPLGAMVLTAVGDLNITASDVITLILCVVGVLEFAQLRANLGHWLIPWLFLGVLIAVALLRGISTYGLGQATNEARELLWAYFAMTWVLATRTDRLKLHTFSLILGWLLVLVALYHGVEHGLGSPTTRVIGVDGSWGPNRILVAGQAAALLLCAGTVLLRTADSGKGRPQMIGSTVAFLGVVIMSQHRSVWIAGFIGITAVLWISARGGRERARVRSRTLIVLAVGSWLVFIGAVLGAAGNEYIDSVANPGTFDWRASGWQALVSEAVARGPMVVVFGEPFGSGFIRRIGDSTIGVSPHNWYLDIFLRLGMIGLIVFAGMMTVALSKSRARSAEWMFSLVAVGVYAWAYSVDWFLAPWLAAAMVVSLRGSIVVEERPGQQGPRFSAEGRLAASKAPNST